MLVMPNPSSFTVNHLRDSRCNCRHFALDPSLLRMFHASRGGALHRSSDTGDRFPRFPSSSHGPFVLCLATLAVIRWLGDVSANRDVLIRRWHGLEAVA